MSKAMQRRMEREKAEAELLEQAAIEAAKKAPAAPAAALAPVAAPAAPVAPVEEVADEPAPGSAILLMSFLAVAVAAVIPWARYHLVTQNDLLVLGGAALAATYFLWAGADGFSTRLRRWAPSLRASSKPGKYNEALVFAGVTVCNALYLLTFAFLHSYFWPNMARLLEGSGIEKATLTLSALSVGLPALMLGLAFGTFGAGGSKKD